MNTTITQGGLADLRIQHTTENLNADMQNQCKNSIDSLLKMNIHQSQITTQNCYINSNETRINY